MADKKSLITAIFTRDYSDNSCHRISNFPNLFTLRKLISIILLEIFLFSDFSLPLSQLNQIPDAYALVPPFASGGLGDKAGVNGSAQKISTTIVKMINDSSIADVKDRIAAIREHFKTVGFSIEIVEGEDRVDFKLTKGSNTYLVAVVYKDGQYTPAEANEAVFAKAQATATKIYTISVNLAYSSPDFETNRDSNAIIALVLSQFKANAHVYDEERQVARISGLPALGGENSLFGENYLRNLGRDLIKKGAAEGLEVKVTFKYEEDRSTWEVRLETEKYPGKIFSFRIFQEHSRGSYDADFQKDTRSYQESTGNVYLVVIDSVAAQVTTAKLPTGDSGGMIARHIRDAEDALKEKDFSKALERAQQAVYLITKIRAELIESGVDPDNIRDGDSEKVSVVIELYDDPDKGIYTDPTEFSDTTLQAAQDIVAQAQEALAKTTVVRKATRGAVTPTGVLDEATIAKYQNDAEVFADRVIGKLQDKLGLYGGYFNDYINEHLRPNQDSVSGFIGPNENLEQLLIDDYITVAAAGYNHGGLAGWLEQISEAGYETKTITINGQTLRVRRGVKRTQPDVFAETVEVTQIEPAARGMQASPMGDKTATNVDYIVENLTTGKRITFSGLMIGHIKNYGFYEGHDDSRNDLGYRLNPADIIEVFTGKLPDMAPVRSISRVSPQQFLADDELETNGLFAQLTERLSQLGFEITFQTQQGLLECVVVAGNKFEISYMPSLTAYLAAVVILPSGEVVVKFQTQSRSYSYKLVKSDGSVETGDWMSWEQKYAPVPHYWLTKKEIKKFLGVTAPRKDWAKEVYTRVGANETVQEYLKKVAGMSDNVTIESSVDTLASAPDSMLIAEAVSNSGKKLDLGIYVEKAKEGQPAENLRQALDLPRNMEISVVEGVSGIKTIDDVRRVLVEKREGTRVIITDALTEDEAIKLEGALEGETLDTNVFVVIRRGWQEDKPLFLSWVLSEHLLKDNPQNVIRLLPPQVDIAPVSGSEFATYREQLKQI